VVRNRVKRLAREAFRALAKQMGGCDVVVIARPAAAKLSLNGMKRALASVGDRMGAPRKGAHEVDQ
jgi:ribonuclease P protein component